MTAGQTILSATDHGALHLAARRVFNARVTDQNLAGCGVGRRRRGGVVTDEPVVVAMVVKKLPAAAISRSRLLPKSVRSGGRAWGIDVVEVGTITLACSPPPQPDKGGPITQRLRPPLQGCSISDASGKELTVGTLGCLVRDKSDKTICLLGSSFVLAQSGAMPIGSPIIQPGTFDGGQKSDKVAKLTRFVPFNYDPESSNETDTAIAQLTDQKAHSEKVAGNLMPPISVAHPAVGTCVAADNHGINCFLAPIDATLSLAGVELLPATSHSSCTVPADAELVGMHIEKVGRTSGYTSSTVAAVGILIKVHNPQTGKTAVFKNMIWTQAFFSPGDSGAVACLGGDGRTFAPTPSLQGNCPMLASVGHYFNLPLTHDNPLTTQARKQFLSQSLVGNLIIGLIYNNADTVVKRTKGKKGTKVQRSSAAAINKRNRHLIVEGLANPKSKKLTVTKGNIDDLNFVLMGLADVDNDPNADPPLLTRAEYRTLHKILIEIVVPTKGMDQKELIRFMNEVSVYEKIVAELKKVKTLNLFGTIADDQFH
jgi:hypothetical protein